MDKFKELGLVPRQDVPDQELGVSADTFPDATNSADNNNNNTSARL